MAKGFVNVVLASVVMASLMSAADAYIESIEKWRKQREERLRADDGWLTVAGLFWLEEGGQTIGSDPASDIPLPEHSVPPSLGAIWKAGSDIELRYAEPGKPPLKLKPDSAGEPTEVVLGDLTFWVIQRGEKYAIRLRDKRSEIRSRFAGCRWYPVKPEYRIEARFEPLARPRTMKIPSSVGVAEEMESPGEVEFEWDGAAIRLTPVTSGDRLFFVFRDLTSGRSTYGAGRFLYTDEPRDGRVILDFNQAYNPPCAFNPYTTCPLPPPQNRLAIPIEAGELNYEEGH